MSKYKTTKQLNLPKIDEEVLAFWEANKVFEKSVSNREGKETYVFYEGPPSANGKPGIHHVMGRAIKDIFCRFNTMKGYQVNRKGGWDTHGLPIELQVEKELGITKEDIGTKISVDEYNKACRETVMRYKNLWDDITIKMGYWVDLSDPYITFESNYIESVWWLLKRLYDKDLLYKGYTIQPYSPAAGTGLSTHELNQPGCYKNVKDTSAVAQFMVKRNEKSAFLYENVGEEDVHLIAWTTTPWTLPSNTALAVGGKIDYVLVKTFNKYTHLPINIVLAKSLFGKWFPAKNVDLKLENYIAGDKTIPYEIVGEFKGTQFEMIEYHQVLSYQQPEEGDAFKVLIGDFVSTEDGTGIVHLAPSFGADDKRVCDKYGIGALTLVDKQGKFVDGVGEFSGRYVKNYKDDPDYVNVDVDISIKLKTENKAFDVKKYEHNYPHCWRTDKPILYYPLDSWFIKAASVKERMQELNNTINWKPKSTGEGRFGKWLENLQDWNLSRSRFWGIPLPIWRTEVDDENPENTGQLCIGSIEQLGQEIDKANAALGLSQEVPKDMHRPYIDDVVLVADDGRRMTRELDLIDVWFDSGSMPYAQWHYPFENKEKFEQNFPADFIAEGVDQTRGWFYTLHAIATMAFDSVAYKNVVSNGLVLDKKGVKMSKRLGNGIDPFETIEAHGADATRWYMISNAQPWDNLKFDPDGLVETRNKFFGTLYNTYQFFSVYANIDKFTYSEADIPMAERPEIDRWVLSLLNTLIKEVSADLSDYEPTNATRKIQEFVGDHLSNWYVRLCRRRFWKGEYEADKISAYQTLYTCLETIAQLMSPIAPFYSDKLFRDLNDVTGRNTAISVHLTDFPTADETLIDKGLEKSMDYAQRISSLILSLRKKNTLRVRQPLQKILLPVLNEGFITQVDGVKDLILQEVNVKEIEYVTDTSGIIKKGVKPNFKTLGRRLGKNMKAGKALIDAMTQEDIAILEANQKFPLVIDGETFELEMEDFVITSEDLEGWLVANDKDLTVALDIHLSDALKAEGMAREIVNRIQNLRKNSGFDVMDKIRITIENHEAIQAAVEQFGDYIKAEVLGESLTLADVGQTASPLLTAETVDLIDEVSVKILVEKV
jgi:isoleucyl-tRNA synthetase